MKWSLACLFIGSFPCAQDQSIQLANQSRLTYVPVGFPKKNLKLCRLLVQGYVYRLTTIFAPKSNCFNMLCSVIMKLRCTVL